MVECIMYYISGAHCGRIRVAVSAVHGATVNLSPPTIVLEWHGNENNNKKKERRKQKHTKPAYDGQIGRP